MATFTGAATGFHQYLASAEADVERLAKFKEEIETIRALAVDGTDPRDLSGEIEAAERALDDYAHEGAFFKPPTSRRERVPTGGGPTDHWRSQRIVWRLGRLDLDHPKPWLKHEGAETLATILVRLRSMEFNIWADIDQMSHNHDWEDLSEWERASLKRLEDLELDDQTGWYQLHLSKMGRLIGFREGNVFNVVWWDKDHDVYVTKRNKKKSQL